MNRYEIMTDEQSLLVAVRKYLLKKGLEDDNVNNSVIKLIKIGTSLQYVIHVLGNCFHFSVTPDDVFYRRIEVEQSNFKHLIDKHLFNHEI